MLQNAFEKCFACICVAAVGAFLVLPDGMRSVLV